MAYKFNFDLSRISKSFFSDIARFSSKRDIHGKIGKIAMHLVKKFKVDKMIGIPVSDAITVVEDLIDNYVRNIIQREEFLKTNKRAILLPHCSRKYMDSRCKASFDEETSSYRCSHCSKDCLINKATKLGEERGYDVFVLPGGSCIRKIIKKGYEAFVGVACTEEIKLANTLLDSYSGSHRIITQGVPLIKNGCSGTKFNLETLKSVL